MTDLRISRTRRWRQLITSREAVEERSRESVRGYRELGEQRPPFRSPEDHPLAALRRTILASLQNFGPYLIPSGKNVNHETPKIPLGLLLP